MSAPEDPEVAPVHEMSGEDAFLYMIPTGLRQRMEDGCPNMNRAWVSQQFVERGTSAEVKLLDALNNLFPEK